MSLGLFHAAPHSEMLRFRVHPFCTPCRFHFRVQAKMSILKRKCTKSACTLKRIQKRKSLKIPINKDFSGKKEDTDIVSISASFVGGEAGI